MRTLLASLILASASLAAGGENLTAETLLSGHEVTDAHAPAAAFGKDVYLVVWEAGRGEKADIVGLRLDKTGKALDTKPFVVCAAKDCQEWPRVAFGGGVFLVVWQDLRGGKDYDVYAARVSPEGKVLDPEGIAVSAEKDNQCQPGLCFDGSVFQLVWRDFRCGADYEIYGGRVGTDGRVMDGPGLLIQKGINAGFVTNTGVPGIGSAGAGNSVAAVSSGQTGFYAWPMQGGRQTQPPTRSGGGNDAGGAFRYVWSPAFASDGKSLLMTFSTYRPISRGGTSPKSGAVLVDVSGSKVAFGTPISVASGRGTTDEWAACIRHPAPVWNGSGYVVAWDIEHAERGKSTWDEVYVRRISADGKPGDKETSVAGEKDSPAFRPAAASDGAGTTVIAYERHPKTGDVPVKIGFRMLTK